MRNSLMILALGVLLLSSACKPDPILEITTDINLNFVATYGDDFFVVQQPYDFEEDVKIQFNEFNFYISNIVLVKEIEIPGNEVEVREIVLLDFTKINNPIAAENGISISALNLPIGDYQGIKFGIGVSPTLNRSKPEEYSVEHPLSLNHLYDADRESYIFSQVTGQLDKNNDGVSDGNFGYHAATDDLFRELIFATKFTLNENSIHNIKLNIDIQRLLGIEDDRIDVANNLTETNFNISRLIADNFAAAISVK